MNDDQDLIMRQIKSFAQGLGEKGLVAAQAQLKKWQQTRLSAHQYQRLNAWIQEQQLINRNPDK